MTEGYVTQCNSCKCVYVMDEKYWASFICYVCKTFIHNKEKKDG